MNKILLLSTSILLCSILAEALVCRVCKIYKQGLGCTVGEATCVAEAGEQCKTVKVFEEKIRYFFRQGCTSPKDKCGSTVEDPMFGDVTTTCCNGKDYCNDIQ
nr:lymphocyte antigen 6 complex locus protein G6c-like [Pogona vitticeps]